jgi:hypothetical protein
MSAGEAMASLLVSSSVAEIFTPSLGLQWEEKKNAIPNINKNTHRFGRTIA